ncbi:hypothetical protein FQA39_LY06563 [Lamprigera yunnana]|nr:hypothetical protein FQA39_LY06563 [Lamprigera yunnana]
MGSARGWRSGLPPTESGNLPAFTRALDEQLREQQLAEQAAAVYHQMLAEQEEIDIMYAQKVAENLEKEERLKKHVVETRDEFYVRNVQDLDVFPLPQRPDKGSPRRQALAMPLPGSNSVFANLSPEPIVHDHDLYTEPYETTQLVNEFDRIEIATELGLPLDQIKERETQEMKDEKFARELQEQEDSCEQSQLNRDRLLAIEAQDKELAKLLQERERQKAKRARERAKQKALAKKQAQVQDAHQIMPDASYSSPADLLPVPQNIINTGQTHAEISDEDLNYIFPVDVLPHKSHDYNLKQNYSPQKSYKPQFSQEMKVLSSNIVDNALETKPHVLQSTATRPTQLDLKLTNYPSKMRFPDPDGMESISGHQSPAAQHTNIAMAIDPTYNRRSQHSVPYYDTSSSTVTTSTSSSSSGIMLPPPDLPEEDDSPIPPYMPIQGQRRTSSLEKKKKRDGCKQQ